MSILPKLRVIRLLENLRDGEDVYLDEFSDDPEGKAEVVSALKEAIVELNDLWGKKMNRHYAPKAEITMRGIFTNHGEGDRPFLINDIDTGTNDVELFFAPNAGQALEEFDSGSMIVPLDGRWCDYCPETYWSGGTQCPTCHYDYKNVEN